jgi:outer membrane protein, heavy metal efflux system
MRKIMRVVYLLWCVWVFPVWAQMAPLTEDEAVRLGLSKGDIVALEQGHLQAAEADVLAAGQTPNPTLSYSHDRVGDAVDSAWSLSQTFDLSGRRGLATDAAGRRVAGASAENAQRRVDLSGEIRRGFYAVVFRQATVRATRAWVDQFARVEAVVGKLARAGEASGYDRRRLTRERQGAEVRLATERAELGRALSRLGVLIGLEGEPNVQGVLLPTGGVSLAAALQRLEQRPDLQAWSRKIEAADLDGRAARRGGVPDLTVGVGPKWTESAGQRNSGLALSLSIPLPVFDRQQAGQRRAAAEALLARAEYRLLRARAEGDLRGVARQVEVLRATVVDYRARLAAASPELLRIAEAAYRGGESSVLELQDAYRGALEAELAALELEHQVRVAVIEYQTISGD